MSNINIFFRKSIRLLDIFRKVVRFTNFHSKENSRDLLLILMMKLVLFVSGTAGIYLSRPVLDDAIMKGNWHLFVKFGLAGAVLFFLIAILEYFSSVLTQGLKIRVSAYVHRLAANNYYHLDYLRARQLASSESAFMMDYDADVITEFIFDEIPSLLSVPKAMVFFFIALYFSWQLALIALLAIPVYLVMTAIFSLKLREYKLKMVSAQRRFIANAQESFLNIKLIKIFAGEGSALKKYMRLLGEYLNAQSGHYMLHCRNIFFDSILSRFFMLVFLLCGGYLIISGWLTVGTFGMVSAYLAMMVTAFGNLAGIFQSSFEDIDSLERSMLLYKGNQVSSRQGPASSPVPEKGSLEIEGLGFGYTKDREVIRGLNLKIEAGKWVGIKGSSGCGKTTLMNLIVRLLQSERGRIRLDGFDIKTIDNNILAANVSIATQEVLLLNDTITENIFYGLEHRDKEEFFKISRIACIDDFISDLPSGLDTVVGEGGFRISEGQKQRVSLARALIRRPRLLVLDEATSSIDPNTEKKIFNNIRENFRRMTVILVSHRDLSMQSADFIYVMSEGRIILS